MQFLFRPAIAMEGGTFAIAVTIAASATASTPAATAAAVLAFGAFGAWHQLAGVLFG
jgi:hypothetical protein